MKLDVRALAIAPALLAAMGCARGKSTDAPGDAFGNGDASCGELCDADGDGVPDVNDKCPNTGPGEVVNKVGCSASQLTPTLEPSFPPYDLAWTTAGDLGRPGGLTWTYNGIQRGDLFDIYWIICDDPATPCGVSLDGPIDSTEGWGFDAPDSMLAAGTLVFVNETHIALADGTMPALTGRLTMTIVDGNNTPFPFADVATLGVTPLLGMYGAEIAGTAFTVVAEIDVTADGGTTWTPFLDYYDAASTPVAGMGATVSFGGSFYDK